MKLPWTRLGADLRHYATQNFELSRRLNALEESINYRKVYPPKLPPQTVWLGFIGLTIPQPPTRYNSATNKWDPIEGETAPAPEKISLGKFTQLSEGESQTLTYQPYFSLNIEKVLVHGNLDGVYLTGCTFRNVNKLICSSDSCIPLQAEWLNELLVGTTFDLASTHQFTLTFKG